MSGLVIELEKNKNFQTWYENRNGFCTHLTAVQLQDIDFWEPNRITLSIRGRSRWLRGGFSIFKTDFIKMCKEFLELNGFEVKEKINDISL